MRALSTLEIATAVSGSIVGENRKITSICTDSRKIEKGCLFVALAGENFDGHKFAKTAAENGAAAVMVHEKVDCDCTVINVFDTRFAFLDLARYYRSLFDIPVVGLTGSVGKTTTKEMTHCVLSEKFKTLKNIENLNNEVGLPKTVFNLDESYEAAVLEMGMNHFGEISRLTKAAQPTLAIISNIGVSHMENLGSQENILKAKLEILEGLKENAPVILNGDDKFLSAAKISGHPVYYFGINSDDCDVKASDIRETTLNTKFVITYRGEKINVTIPTVGIHNVYNALAAFTAGVLLDIEPKTAAKALENYVPAGMRQRVVLHKGLTIIEDCYNASPDSMKAALNILKKGKGKNIAVLGDMLELGEISQQAHYNVGVLASESQVDCLFTYGEEAKQIARAAQERNLTAYSFTDKEELTRKLLETIDNGDCLLFKASRGMKLEEVIHALYEGF